MTEEQIREAISKADVESISDALWDKISDYSEGLHNDMNELKEYRDELIKEAFPNITDEKDLTRIQLILMQEHDMMICLEEKEDEDDIAWLENWVAGKD